MKLFLAPVFGLALLAQGPAQAQLLPPNEAGITMGHVHLNVTDVEAHKKIWIEQFGATAIKSDRLQGVKIPGMLILFRKQEPTGPSEGTVLEHFGIRVPNTAKAVERWRAAGLPVQREFKGTQGFPNAYIIAPGGVKIELQEDSALTTPAATHHLHYYVSDPQPIRSWYVEKLSFTPTHRGTHESADVPGMNLSFQPSKTPPTIGTKGRAIDHVGFEVKNLEAFCKKLEANGVKLDAPYKKIPELGLGLAFLTDPWGVYIELTEGLDAF